MSQVPTINIDRHLHRKIKSVCALEGISMTTFVREAILDRLEDMNYESEA